jgi:hypothetical protein
LRFTCETRTSLPLCRSGLLHMGQSTRAVAVVIKNILLKKSSPPYRREPLVSLGGRPAGSGSLIVAERRLQLLKGFVVVDIAVVLKGLTAFERERPLSIQAKSRAPLGMPCCGICCGICCCTWLSKSPRGRGEALNMPRPNSGGRFLDPIKVLLHDYEKGALRRPSDFSSLSLIGHASAGSAAARTDSRIAIAAGSLTKPSSISRSTFRLAISTHGRLVTAAIVSIVATKVAAKHCSKLFTTCLLSGQSRAAMTEPPRFRK